jgi:hypothetical protein
MISLKGFAQISSLVDNQATVTAPIGELTPLSKSFAREQATYVTADVRGIELIAFQIKVGEEVLTDWNNGTIDPQMGTDFQTHVSDMLTILQWIHVQGATGRFNQNVDNFKSQYIAQWGETYALENCGAMATGTGMWIPSWVEITRVVTGAAPNSNKIWLAGEAFESQYDGFEILPVPPIASIDDFFTSYTHIKNLLAAITLTETMKNVNIVKDGYPDTNVITTSFEFIDPLNRALRLPVDWTVVVYGSAGENLDNIKEAIIGYVLANSTQPRVKWEAIFPDIFHATEFIVTPMWNNYSIPNRELEAGMYSPAVPVNDALVLATITAKGTGYTPEHISKVLQIVPNTYKQIGLAIVGGVNNRNGVNQFNRQFKDYLSLASTHLDFQRMDIKTRGFIVMLSGMLRFAESMTPQSSVPREHTRTVREGVIYLSRTYDRIQYLVVTKYSLNDPATGIPDLLLDGDGYTLTDGNNEELV